MSLDPTITQAKEYIYKINFDQIIDKMIYQLRWNREHAEKVCKYYRNYLYLSKKYGATHKFPPTEEIDEFWHMHILDTEKYTKDCKAIFGKYFHHYPYFGIDGETNSDDLLSSFEKLQLFHEKEFNGERIIQVRSIPSRFISFIKYLKTRGGSVPSKRKALKAQAVLNVILLLIIGILIFAANDVIAIVSDFGLITYLVFCLLTSFFIALFFWSSASNR